MKNLDNTLKIPLLFVILTIVVKLPFLLTHHIQEDAFITWRVAQNLLDYGVIGFNDDTKISASTTHLYVFVSYFFNLIFGKEHFTYPILIFNSTLFTFGSYFLAKMILKNHWHQAFFVLLFGLLPPSIKVSILGMEYGILFFLEMALLYFGFYQNKKWAIWILPSLILFTRLDTAIFLGIVFLVDTIWNKKIRWEYVFSGIIAVAILVSFNWFYFNELVNNTILAEKLAYAQDYNFTDHLHYFLNNWGNFWGMLKMPGQFNPFTILVLIFELLCFIFLVRQNKKRNMFLYIIFIFGWMKQIIFLSQKSYFDWYYWVPQILLFVSVLIFILELKEKKYVWQGLFLMIYFFPMLGFQTIHSIATGNSKWNDKLMEEYRIKEYIDNIK